MTHKKTLGFLFLMLSLMIFGQKIPLNHSVYDGWQSVGTKKISKNGTWVAYSVDVQEGDSELFLQSLQSKSKLNFARAKNVDFTSDSQFAVFMIKPFYKDIKAVKGKKLKSDKLTKDTLSIVDLNSGKVLKIEKIESYKIPEKGGFWLAYLKADPKEKSEEDDKDKKEEKSSKPMQLVLRNLKSGTETTFENVTDYTFSENGKSLSFITEKPEEKKKSEEKNKNKDTEKKSDSSIVAKEKDEKKDKSKPVKFPLKSINIVDVESGNLVKVEELEGDFKQMVLDDDGEQLAFASTVSAKNDLVKNYDFNLYHKNSQKKTKISNTNSNMKKGWVISENRRPIFSKNGKQLFFGVAPKSIPKDTALIINDHAIVDVWTYKDEELMTIQLKNLRNDLKKSYAAVLQTSNPEIFVNLDDGRNDTIRLINRGDANFVLGVRSENKLASQWEGNSKRTYFLVNTLTGNSTEIVKDLNGNLDISPLGKFAVYFDRVKGNWFKYDISTRKTTHLNEKMKVNFADEEFDMPDFPRPYGIASYTKNDESVIIKDRYDLWEFSLMNNEKPRNVTNGFGRKNKISFNTYNLDKEEKGLDRTAPIYLYTFNEDNKQSGIFKTTINSGTDPEKIQMLNEFAFLRLIKAEDAEGYLYTKESYKESPNLFATQDFRISEQLSNINPQQAKYIWGTAELVNWKTNKGNKSQGILYKPENFDPNKKYPMIVYFYEKLSDGLNRYIPPAPTPSRLNISYFVSNGYLVFAPDISYKDGHPGKSAMEYINSGVEHLKKNAWVNGSKIGIQGQSWGGYQVAYLIAHTNMYAAAWAGAPVVNMTSAYGGIRWSTGMNRQFQYEKTQSRIGKNLWEAPKLYMENSPLFNFPKVETPVAIMHNDQDGAVPWYQGIEMFTALRRLQKPVWLLNYNGDDHNLMKRQNRKDIQIREKQFFDYYLKGAKAPEWMVKGVKATMKGKDWGFELTDEKP